MTSAPTVRYLDRATAPHISTLILLTGLSTLGMNVFLPSLPGMSAHFDTDYRVMQLSVAVFLGVSAVLQILIGPVSDKMGRRPVILGGLILFLLATIGCIFAPSAEVFLFFRMCQAISAVGMVLGRAAVRDMYSQDRAASMLGYVAMGMAVVPILGPAIGGVLDEAFGWTANFWLLIAMGVLAWMVTWADFGETAHKSGKSLAAQFREYPELLTSPRFWGYSLCAAFVSGAFFAYLGGAPFVGTEVFDMSPSELGYYFGAPAAGYIAGNFVSGRYSTRVGINPMIAGGCVVSALGIVLSIVLFYAGSGTPLTFFGFMAMVGVGNGMVMPNSTAGMLSVRPHLAGTASGLGGAINLGGGAALSAQAGAMLTPETGAFPLLWMMLITTLFGLVAIAVVIWRARRLGL